MQISELLKQIKPCDMDEPFVFISYSSLDNRRVWEDVLRFQQMGYNVWLDEKNLDKTKASWRDDALEAIKDFNCELLVYYVSRHSLVSQNCFRELECTTDYDTVATHNGPLKFIAVDAEPIDDIIQFKQQVHTQIKHSKSLSKEDIRRQMLTMQKCVDQFFDSNNEKIRVKAYGLPNRKMDYYEEITASFPDESRIYAPTVEKTEPKTVVKENPAAAPVEPPKPAPQPQKPVQAEKKPEPKKETVTKTESPRPAPVAPKAAVTQTPAKPEKREEPKKPSALLSADRMILGFVAVKRANEVFHKAGKRGFKDATELSDIQRQNLQKYIARTSFIPMVEGLLDTTMLQSGEEGILVTNWNFNWTLYSTAHTGVDVPLMKVVGVRNSYQTGRLCISLSDGKELNMQFGAYADGIRALLETFVEANRERFGVKQNLQEYPVDKMAKAGTGSFSLKKAITDANKALDGYYIGTRFILIEDASAAQIQKLKSVIEKKPGIKMTDIVACKGFEGRGAQGIIITKDRVYGTWGDVSYPYKDVTHVEHGLFSSQMRITYENQKPQTATFDMDYFMPVMRFFEACIDQRT